MSSGVVVYEVKENGADFMIEDFNTISQAEGGIAERIIGEVGRNNTIILETKSETYDTG